MTRTKITQRLAATALAAAMLAAAAVPSMAQPAPAAPVAEQGAAPAERHHRRATPEQRQQFMAQRAEAFKNKLQLTPAQEPAWNTFQQSMQPEAGARHARLDRQALQQLTTPERIDRMRALRAQRTAEADRRGDAVKAFYATLTPAQQKTFDAEGNRMHGHQGKRGEKHGHHGMRHHGAGAAPTAQ